MMNGWEIKIPPEPDMPWLNWERRETIVLLLRLAIVCAFVYELRSFTFAMR